MNYQFLPLCCKQTQTDPCTFVLSQECCSCCMKSIWVKDSRSFSCGHTFCLECLNRIILSQLEEVSNLELRCPICLKILRNDEISMIDPMYLQAIDERCSQRIQESLVTCPNCQTSFSFEPGDRANITTDPSGNPIGPAALECIRLNRCTCYNCQKNFCVSCKTTPFHDGYTCSENQLILDGIVCRFCEKPVHNGRAISPSLRVCQDPLCHSYLRDSCTHILDCGHPCCGLLNEQTHLPCAQCDFSALCCYCGDPLSTKPSIALKCGHFSHLECVDSHLKTCSLDKKIILPRCAYPGCNQLPSHPRIDARVAPFAQLAAEIDRMIRHQMELEKTDQDPHVLNPEDQDYYQQPYKYAQANFLFFRCERCRNPYYGGHRECGAEELNEGEHYVCNRCGRQGLDVCRIHGEEGMIYKCFFCCRPAAWFCFGNTHFCEQCHQRPSDSQKGPWPQCSGNCQFAPHPPNGTKQKFGICAICHSQKQKAGNFD